MGLGGYLTWTALSREIHSRHGLKIIPMEVHGSVSKLIKSEAFHNNPTIVQKFDGSPAIQVHLNNPITNYCQQDTPQKAFHKSDRHIIQTICAPYGIDDPNLRCEIFLDEKENSSVSEKLKKLPEVFLTIEPYSKDNYTPNRAYPIEKWQKVVNDIYEKIPVVQLGLPGHTLENVIDLTGETTFREASGIIQKSSLFVSSEGGLVHAATSTDTKSLVIITGYQTTKMVGYPQNYNVNISSHGPCGLKVPCSRCQEESSSHDHSIISKKIREILCL